MIDDARRAPILLFDGGNVPCPRVSDERARGECGDPRSGGMMREGRCSATTTFESPGLSCEWYGYCAHGNYVIVFVHRSRSHACRVIRPRSKRRPGKRRARSESPCAKQETIRVQAAERGAGAQPLKTDVSVACSAASTAPGISTGERHDPG